MPLYTNWNADSPYQRYLEELPTDPTRARSMAVREGFEDTIGVLSFEAGFRRGVSGANLEPAVREARGGDARYGHQIARKEAESIRDAEGFSFYIPPDGMNSKAMERILQRQRDRRRRENVIARSTVGGFQRFMLNMAGSIPDPANIVLLPFAPEAAAVKGLGTAARVATRARTGFKIGLIEGTAFEIPHHQLANAAGDDLTMFDAFSNVVMAGLIGGTLHVGGGVIRDFKTGKVIDDPTLAEPPNRTADAEALQTAIVQLSNDQPINVDPVVLPKAEWRLAELDLQIRRAMDEGDRVAARELAELKTRIQDDATDFTRRSPDTDAVINRIDQQIAARGRQGAVPQDKQGMERAQALRADAQRGLNTLAKEPRHSRFFDEKAEARVRETVPPKRPGGLTVDDLGEEIGPEEFEATALATEEIDDMRRQIESLEDPEALRTFDEVVAAADDIVQETTSFVDAVRAGALCSIRKGGS